MGERRGGRGGNVCPVGRLLAWLSCDMQIHETLGINTIEFDGHDTSRKIDAYATDAYNCIVCFIIGNTDPGRVGRSDLSSSNST